MQLGGDGKKVMADEKKTSYLKLDIMRNRSNLNRLVCIISGLLKKLRWVIIDFLCWISCILDILLQNKTL